MICILNIGLLLFACPFAKFSKMFRQSLKVNIRLLDIFTRTCRCFTSFNSVVKPIDGKNRPFNEIPGPKGWPFIGIAFDYKTHGVENIFLLNEKYFKEYGSIYKETVMGKTFVNICDPADIEKVFRAETKYPSRGIDFEFWHVWCRKRGLVSNVFFLDGEEWWKARKMLAPKMMRPKDLHNNYVDKFEEVAEDAITSLKKARGDGRTEGEVFFLAEELKNWALESIGTVVLGTRVGMYDTPPRKGAQELMKAMDDISDAIMALSFGIDAALWRYVNTKSWTKFCKAFDVLYAVGGEYMTEGIEQLKRMEENGDDTKKGSSLLEYLLLKENVTVSDVITTAINMLTAGVDTTATTLLWLLYHLGRNEEAQEQAYSEVISVIDKDGKFNPDHLRKIPYLRACLKESMRLVPIGAFNSRILEVDVELHGYHIPARTLIRLSTMFLQYSEEYFDKPHQFRPERWLREGGEEIHPFAHIPFGFGLRMCMGKRIAEMEIFIFLSKILRHFKIKYIRDDKIQPIQKLIMVPNKPIHLYLCDRID